MRACATRLDASGARNRYARDLVRQRRDAQLAAVNDDFDERRRVVLARRAYPAAAEALRELAAERARRLQAVWAEWEAVKHGVKRKAA